MRVGGAGEFEAASADSHCIFNDVIAFDLRTLRWRVVMEGGWDPYDERPRPPLHSFSMVHFTVPHPFGYVRRPPYPPRACEDGG
jgi:hypothetical protein